MQGSVRRGLITARIHRGIFFLVSVGFAASAAAQNLVSNPDFDVVLAPWAQFLSSAPDPVAVGAVPVRASKDINNNASSGSALIDINTATAAANAASGISQCFDFPSATAVNFVKYRMSFLVPAMTIADSSLNATVEMRLYSSAGCSGFVSGGSQGRVLVPGLASDTIWYTVGDDGFVPNGAPVSASSAEIRGYLRQTGAAPTQIDYKTNLDHIVLILNSTVPVELQNYEVD